MAARSDVEPTTRQSTPPMVVVAPMAATAACAAVLTARTPAARAQSLTVSCMMCPLS